MSFFPDSDTLFMLAKSIYELGQIISAKGG